MKKYVLVTGAAGFIGHNFCIRLLKEGYDILALDNFNNYYDPKLKEENITRVFKTAEKLNKEVILYREDIRDKTKLEDICQTHKPIAIAHFAQNAGVRPSIEEPLFYVDVNINGMMNVLEVMRNFEIKKLVFISSSSVYGNNKKVPFSEKDFVDKPISPYAASKKACELFAHTYHSLFKLDIHCLRYFTVYGPCQRPDLAINKFTRLMLNGEEIPMFGDGTTSRDYTYIDDIVEGTYLSFNYLMNHENVYDVFNLGGSNPVKLIDMIKTIENSLNMQAKIKRLPMQKGDVDITYSDFSHAKEVLGYEPKTRLQEGINNFVKWYLKHEN